GSPRGRQPRQSDRTDASPSPTALSTFNRSRFSSPLQKPSTRAPSAQARSDSRSAVADELRRRLAMPFKLDHTPNVDLEPGSEDSVISDEVEHNTNANSGEPREEVTLGHVLTNTVI